MAKGKNLNPADAQRKAERKKELKKNKTERQKTRDFALVKKDTTDLEEEIERLEKAETDETITPAQKTRLPALRVELKRINKKKDDWVAEHPEHRKLVYRAHHKTDEKDGETDKGKKKERKVFDKHGIPRHPERSVYYDPVMNPFGVPPPGMPYMERPLRPDEIDSQAEDDSEGNSDNDIAMPSGPPPSSKNDGDDDDDEQISDGDIPMPEGPPPPQVLPPLPLLPPPPTTFTPVYLNSSMNFSSNFVPPPPPSAPGRGVVPHSSFPPPPPGFPAVPPPPPPGFPPHSMGRASLPPRPRIQSNASMQDPLSSAPHQTFQDYRTNQAQTRTNHPLPDKPTSVAAPPIQVATQPAAISSAGTISAPAQLRDLKKESTAFMPSSLKRKRPGGVTGTTGGLPASKRINAAPTADTNEDSNSATEAVPVRPDLLGALQSNFPAPLVKHSTGEEAGKKRKVELPEAIRGKDDYAKFMEDIGDIL